MRFKVIIRPDLEDGGFNVSCPALPVVIHRERQKLKRLAIYERLLKGAWMPSMNARGFALQMKSCLKWPFYDTLGFIQAIR